MARSKAIRRRAKSTARPGAKTRPGLRTRDVITARDGPFSLDGSGGVAGVGGGTVTINSPTVGVPPHNQITTYTAGQSVVAAAPDGVLTLYNAPPGGVPAGVFNAAQWNAVSRDAGGINDFSATSAYGVGESVYHTGPDGVLTLYRSNAPVSAGTFNPAQWDEISRDDGGIADHSATAAYLAGELVVHNDGTGFAVYRASTNNGPSAFSPTNFEKLGSQGLFRGWYDGVTALGPATNFDSGASWIVAADTPQPVTNITGIPNALFPLMRGDRLITEAGAYVLVRNTGDDNNAFIGALPDVSTVPDGRFVLLFGAAQAEDDGFYVADNTSSNAWVAVARTGGGGDDNVAIALLPAYASVEPNAFVLLVGNLDPAKDGLYYADPDSQGWVGVPNSVNAGGGVGIDNVIQNGVLPLPTAFAWNSFVVLANAPDGANNGVYFNDQIANSWIKLSGATGAANAVTQGALPAVNTVEWGEYTVLVNAPNAADDGVWWANQATNNWERV